MLQNPIETEELFGWREVLGPITPCERSLERVELELALGSPVHREDGVVQRSLEFNTEIDDRVQGLLLEPSNGSRGVGVAAIYLHQTTDDPNVGMLEPVGLAGNMQHQYGADLARRGFSVIGVNYPGFGGYDYPALDRGYKSVSAKGLWNHICTLDVIQHLFPACRNRVAAIGHSLGGTNALLLACADLRVKAVVASGAITTFERFATTHGDLSRWANPAKYMPLIESLYGSNPNRVTFDLPDLVLGVHPRPLFLAATEDDEIFDIAGASEAIKIAKDAYAASGCARRFESLISPGGHGFHSDARVFAYDFLVRELRP